MARSILDPITQAFSEIREEHAEQSGQTPSILSLKAVQDFLTVAGDSAIEDLGSPLVRRVGWVGPASDRSGPEIKDLWVALVDPMDQLETLPLRQIFVRVRPHGQLEAGMMSIVADAFLQQEDIQKELRTKCPDIFRMIAKRRKGGKTAEAWSLDWCEPLMARSEIASDVNDWLSLTSSLKSQKIRCISVSREFATGDANFNQLSADIRKTIGRLSRMLETPSSEQLSEKLIQPGDAFVSALAALDSGQLTQAGTDALLGVIRDVLRRGGFPDIVVRAVSGDQSGNNVGIEFALPRRQRADSASSRAGMKLVGGKSQVALFVEQRHQYALKKFGGRTAIAKMHQARRQTQNAMSCLNSHGFDVEQHVLDIDETPIEKVQQVLVSAHSVFEVDAIRNDQFMIAALIEMVRVFRDLSHSQAV